jgi:fatty acid kinase fatty acid binding subunit
MKIVGDMCADLFPEQLVGLSIPLVPLTFTLDGKVYRGGLDMDSDAFYRLISATPSFPTTSQPSVGDFVEVYRRLAAQDRDILSVHVSTGLSGTYNSAVAAARIVSEANITVYDSKLVSAALGWLVEAAGRAALAGWSSERIVAMLDSIVPQIGYIFTVPSLRYLIHGGRISHLKGLLGTALGVKPLIAGDTKTGLLAQAGQARTMKAALEGIISHIAKKHARGSALRVQVLHGSNPDAMQTLHDLVNQEYDCTWMPSGAITPVLGAHTGPGLVGVFYAPVTAFAEVPHTG